MSKANQPLKGDVTPTSTTSSRVCCVPPCVCSCSKAREQEDGTVNEDCPENEEKSDEPPYCFPNVLLQR